MSRSVSSTELESMGDGIAHLLVLLDSIHIFCRTLIMCMDVTVYGCNKGIQEFLISFLLLFNST